MEEKPRVEEKPKEEEKPKVVEEPPKKTKFSVMDIKRMIAEAKSEEITKLASPQLVKEVEEMKTWVKKEEIVEVVAFDNPKLNKKNSKVPNNNEFKKGRNYNPSSREPDFNMGSNFGKSGPSVPDITIGKNESLETRILKKDLR